MRLSQGVRAMFTLNLSKLFLLILFLPLPAMAQTSDELRQKYKVTSAVESYEVRPGIIATVFYGENGQPVEILIKPRLFYTNDLSKNEVAYKLFEELLDEFVPVAKRGKYCGETDSVSGRNHYVYTAYENVSIYSVIHKRGAENATASMIQIKWEKIYCPSAISKPPSNNSLNRSANSGAFIHTLSLRCKLDAIGAGPVNSGVRQLLHKVLRRCP
jgi:hypothetical protein